MKNLSETMASYTPSVENNPTTNRHLSLQFDFIFAKEGHDNKLRNKKSCFH